MSSFLSVQLVLSVVDFALGRVLVASEDALMLEVETLVLGLVTPVLSDPFLDILLVTELREALELDLLRFSFELLGCCCCCLLLLSLDVVEEEMFLAFLMFSVDR